MPESAVIEHWCVSVVIDGALVEEAIYVTRKDYDNWFTNLTEECEDPESYIHGQKVEAFVQYHGHPIYDDECACAQYEQDHHPEYTWDPTNPPVKEAQ